MSTPPLFWVYLGYLVYAIYTGFYVYNRRRGRSAQFGTARVMPDDGPVFKLFADVCVTVTFVFSACVVLWLSFGAAL